MRFFVANQTPVLSFDTDDPIHLSPIIRYGRAADKLQSARGLLFEAGVEIAFAKIAAAFEPQADCRTKQNVAVSPRIIPVIAVLLALLHAVLAVTATIDKSPTFDEPVHLTAGYSYWLRNDFRFDPENGNLPARWAALPLLGTQPHFPSAENESWKQFSVGESSHQFFYGSGNNPDAILLQGRIMMSAFSAALCLVIFFCGQKLFGIMGGFISETIAVFDPNLLAHGALATSDVAAAFLFTAAAWAVWRLLHRISILTLTLSALTVSGLFLTKMSAPLFLIMAAILSGLRIFSRDLIEIRIAGFDRIFGEKAKKFAVAAALALAIGAAVVVFIWASFCFRFSALPESGHSRDLLNARWNYLLANHTAVENVIAFARDHRLLPEAYLFGLAYVHERSQDRPAFLDNHWSNTGFRSFFPRAFYYKTPLPILCLMVMGVFAAFLRWNRRWKWKSVLRDCANLAPVWVVLLVYGAAALMTNLNIGHRHLLPIYPPLFIACGACAHFIGRLRTAVATVGVLLCWQLGESFIVRPHYLAYFNQIAGGPANGYRHLVDSSLDWGQDLPALKMWLERQERSASEKVYLSYFGTGDPKWYGIQATTLPENAETFASLQPGFYCVSATTLQRVYAIEQGEWAQPYENAYQSGLTWLQGKRTIDDDPQERMRRTKIFQRLRFGRLCAYLRHREPLANIGYSIVVYHLTQDDLRAALDGPPAELEREITVAGK